MNQNVAYMWRIYEGEPTRWREENPPPASIPGDRQSKEAT